MHNVVRCSHNHTIDILYDLAHSVMSSMTDDEFHEYLDDMCYIEWGLKC